MEAIIVDDEITACEALHDMVSFYCPDIKVINYAHSIESANDLVNTSQPDLLFLDIKMPDGSGFDLLNKLNNFNGLVIFISAYDEFAIEAFRVNAFNYLLKPVDPDLLVSVIRQARVRLNNQEKEGGNSLNNKLALNTEETIHLIDFSDIVRCESEGNYTRFYITGRKSILVAKTLKNFEPYLRRHGFFRVHRSHLVNLKAIESYEKRNGGFVMFKDGSFVPVASRKKELFLKRLGNI